MASSGDAGVRTSEGPNDQIRPLVAAVILHGDRMLVWDDYDPKTGEIVAVPIAGGIEFGETSAQAVRREVAEELGAPPARIRFLGVLEDIFPWAGQSRHELWFAYEVVLEERGLYDQEVIEIVEDDGTAYPARWRGLSEFAEGIRLVPDGLLRLIIANPS